MRTKLIVTSGERASLVRLGQTLRLARIRRRLTQSELADRMGVARGSVIALETGSPGVSLAILAKAMTLMGYPDRLGELLAFDPIGDDMDETNGRQRVGRRTNVVGF